jgi:3-oxoacyl-[acyl-carrier protein] reductase
MLVDMNANALAAARESLITSGAASASRVATCACNVTIEADVERAVAATKKQFGRIDVLVQSAGITGKTGIKTEEVDVSNFDLVFAVNSTGIFLFMKHCLPVMRKQCYGRIVNIASVAGKEGNAGMLAYSASKAAVIGLTKATGKEYAETGITVNAVAPAVVRTALVEAMPPSQVKYMTDKIPMKRCGQIAEIASLVAFAASKEASFTTGFTFDATGGRATY